MNYPRPLEKTLEKLDTPPKIQNYLEKLKYNGGDKCHSPLHVVKNKRAYCFEGALFAAACMKYHGHKPLIVDLRAVNDDDHIIAVYKRNGLWGALSKSNFLTLQYREPIYRSLRELAQSYFNFYYNIKGEKTLREYSRPMNLNRFNGWETTDEDLNYLGEQIDKMKHYPITAGHIFKNLRPVNPKLLKASLMGAKLHEVYKP
ncbi:MAG: hypothetical protein KKD39_05100 [Candidatus Altiarchaeota archaeon]|nr:hypothetical protein [Candidatus Altiarchaeota archaeon]